MDIVCASSMTNLLIKFFLCNLERILLNSVLNSRVSGVVYKIKLSKLSFKRESYNFFFVIDQYYHIKNENQYYYIRI